MDEIQKQLVSFARHLGSTEKDLVILGEGNVSGKDNPDTFWVKASGTSLRDLEPSGLVEVTFLETKKLLQADNLTDDDIRLGLQRAKVDPDVEAVPSVETFLHAILLKLDGINFVGHTHPTAVNSILCSKNAKAAYDGSLYPDQIVYCGPAPAFVPYTDPGLPLAKKVFEVIEKYISDWGETPKIILMQNHGLIAIGATPAEVENITEMSVKAARIILRTYCLGGPNFLSSENVARIHTRPDEQYRKGVWGVD